MKSILSVFAVAALFISFAANLRAAEKVRVQFLHDHAHGQMAILVDGKEAMVYQHGKEVDLPHYFPVRSPSGKSLTVQKTEPYPHHRSFWFADTVQLAGTRKASFYNALYSQVDKKDPKSSFRDRVRSVEFQPGETKINERKIVERLLWEIDLKTPVLDERRDIRVVALDGGEYFVDIVFTVTASYGDVTFLSDAAHYAWPYIRISPEFSVEKGATMTNSEGGVNQAQTHDKPARWVDYSNTIRGVTEGLALFSHSDNEHPHTWLTRDYGTFGPRRAGPRNGKPFVLKKGESLKQRVGVLVHTGDVKTGAVAKRYEQYIAGKL